MAYVDVGAGAPVLCLHGNPTWGFLWRELVRAGSEQFRFIVPDHVGCGRSDKPPASSYPYTLERRVADLGRLIDTLAVPRISLVAHDWGGMIGLAWAVQNPQRIERIVLMNTAGFPLPPGRGLPATLVLARLPVVGALLVRGANAFVDGALRACVVRPLRKEVADAYRAPYGSWADRVAVHRFVLDVPVDERDPAWRIVQATADGLPRLKSVPTRILWGRKDFVFDDTFLAEWRRRAPGASVRVFEDAGHLLIEDETVAVVEDTLAFLGAGAT